MMLKRIFDITTVLLSAPLWLPVVILVAAAVRIRIGSPVLFRQERPGLRARPFIILKFRTMKAAFDTKGQPLPDAERMTRFGALLRSTSLDELPELFNVLKGDMSLVGPRPLLMEYLPLYSKEQSRRHEVRPGITGWAQVNGRNAINWEQRFQLDVWYVDNHSIPLDLRILSLTMAKVLKRENVNESGQATMSKFKGNTD
ncbi:MAG TPA: sugar transferase [Deltaproteobacteria bacterium]|nr:sugar transferase [Deltaproteobacteria bacterium]